MAFAFSALAALAQATSLSLPAPSERLLVHLTGGAATLERAGFAARPLSPDVAAVDTDPAGAARLRALPGARVDVGRRLRPHLDRSGPLIGAPQVRGRLGLSGKGVYVAVIDTGLDLRHGDFRGQDGRTRVRWLLDAAQSRRGLHPEIGDYAGLAVFNAADIDAVLGAEARGEAPPPALLHLSGRDPSGHGTHVAGIAAGGGLESGEGLPAGRYVGVAPEADLCVVQGSRDGGRSFLDEDILIGVRFCRDRAADEGRPLVINLSLGALGGPHDGTSPLEVALDQLVGQGQAQGVALVTSAGNFGNQDGHAGGYLPDPASDAPGQAEVRLVLTQGSGKAPRGAAGQLDMELYGAEVLAVTVTSPAGGTAGPAAPGQDLRVDLPEGQVRLTSDPREAGRRHRVAVSLRGPAVGQPPALGEWRLRVAMAQAQTMTGAGPARWDVWLAESTPDLRAHLADHLDADTQIEMPATARSALSVGAFASRLTWPRKGGGTSDPFGVAGTDAAIVGPSLFSAAGPAADGRLLPDVSAPGEFILSSLSRDSTPDVPGSVFSTPASPGLLWADDGVHAALRGTSQAAPHVSGALALLLQRSPTLTGERLREVLRVCAQGSGYGPRQGFGWLNVEVLVRHLLGERPGPVDPATSGVGVAWDLIPPRGATVITVVPRDRAGLPLPPGQPVEIEATAGTFEGPVRDLGSGRYERTLRAGDQRGVAALITARVGGVELLRRPRVSFEIDRRAALPQEDGAGGCEATRRGSFGGEDGAPLGLAVMLGLALVRLRRRSGLAR